MKKVIYIDSFIDLEREYMKKHNPYLIEESLLYSFSKKELNDLIKSTKNQYLKDWNSKRQIFPTSLSNHQ